MLAETTHAECHDGGEDDGLEEERDEEQGDASVATVRDRWCEEHDAAGQVEDEDPAGTDESHQESSDEAAEGEATLGSGEELGGARVGVFLIGVCYVVDEL